MFTSSISFIGPIPIELTRLALLEKIDLEEEPLLTGFLKEELASFSFFGFWKLGEFPLVDESFRNLIEVYFPDEISSLDDKNFHFSELILFVVVFDRSWNFIRFCWKKQARIETKVKLWKTQQIQLKERETIEII